MLTEAEVAQKKAELEAHKKAQEGKKPEEAMEALQTQMQNLSQAMTSLKNQQGQSDKLKADEIAAKVEAEAADAKAKLEAEADIKNLLAQEGDDDDGAFKERELSSKQVLDVVANAFETAMQAQSKQQGAETDAKLNKIVEQIKGVQTVFMQMQASAGLKEARAKFSDFDTYKEDIVEVMKVYPGIDLKDAYLLAKSKKASDAPPRTQLASEKPVNLATRAEDAAKRFDEEKVKREREPSKGNTAGRVKFRDTLKAAAEKVLSERHA